MKKLNNYIFEKLKINKDVSSVVYMVIYNQDVNHETETGDDYIYQFFNNIKEAAEFIHQESEEDMWLFSFKLPNDNDDTVKKLLRLIKAYEHREIDTKGYFEELDKLNINPVDQEIKKILKINGTK